MQPGVRAWLRLGRVVDKIGRRLDAQLKRCEMTPAQFDVLAQLQAAPDILQQELADRLVVTKGNVVGLLDRMQGAGLVERRDHPHDGRAHLVCLTGRGEQMARTVVPEHEALVAECMAVLTPDELKTLSSLLRKLERGLDTE